MDKQCIRGKASSNKLKRSINIIRISAFFICFSVMASFASNSFSQEIKLSLALKSTSIKDVCKEIESKIDYIFVFSDNISHKLTKRFGILDYYDPDTSYYEDVTAYINAFKEFAETYGENQTGMFPTFDEYQKDKEISKKKQWEICNKCSDY